MILKPFNRAGKMTGIWKSIEQGEPSSRISIPRTKSRRKEKTDPWSCSLASTCAVAWAKPHIIQTCTSHTNTYTYIIQTFTSHTNTYTCVIQTPTSYTNTYTCVIQSTTSHTNTYTYIIYSHPHIIQTPTHTSYRHPLHHTDTHTHLTDTLTSFTPTPTYT